MALIVIDASVVIALLDPADPLHASARREFDQVAGEELALPASTLAKPLWHRLGPANWKRPGSAFKRSSLSSLLARPAPPFAAARRIGSCNGRSYSTQVCSSSEMQTGRPLS